MRLRAVAAVLAFALLAPIGAPAGAVAVEPCAAPSPGGTTIAEIVDGRTVRAADGSTVVLAGIEIPQAAGRDRSLAAAGWLEDKVSGRPVRLAASTAPDRYGRVHAQLFLDDGSWLQGELVAAGLAIARPDGVAETCMLALLEREQAAREKKRGIWGESESPLFSADDPSLSARNGLYSLIEGRVLSVGFGSSMVFLDFGRDYRTDFTVMVSRPIAARLTDAGIPVDALKGRRIRVRGVIEESGGPAVRIADPNQLEVVSQRQ